MSEERESGWGGGIAEDFLHVAGLVQVSVGNGTMRPFLLVGIENTERRRDMTGPTENADDKKIAPRAEEDFVFCEQRGEGAGEIAQRFAETLGRNAPPGVRWHYEKMPDEKHSTIYHPAALKAFRAVFGPTASR